MHFPRQRTKDSADVLDYLDRLDRLRRRTLLKLAAEAEARGDHDAAAEWRFRAATVRVREET